jgi:hypothetical protein
MATLDTVYNLVKLTVSGTYGAADISIVVASLPSALSGGGWNATWYNSTDYPDPSNDPNAEIIRVTAASGTTLTIQRGAESSTGGGAASTKNTAGKTYTLILGVTAKMITDIGSNLQKPWRLVNVDGVIDGVNTIFTLHGNITPFDPNSMHLRFARQEQEQGIDYTLSGTTITYITPPDPSLAGLPHVAQYQ